MDRCRCEEYAEAVKKLRFYTVGTFRPDMIDNYDRTGYITVWRKHGADYADMKFSKPFAIKILEPKELPQSQMSKESWKKEQMWCPYMTPYKLVDEVPKEQKESLKSETK